MGCWNETCVLTRLPIHYGAPVIALTSVYGPEYKTSAGSALKNDLLFGMPLEGSYDDYGGVERLAHPEIDKLHEKAFIEAGYYKPHVVKKSYGSASEWLLAAHPDSFWSLTSRVKTIYYPELGVKLSEVNAYDAAARAKQTEAHKRAEAALEQLGKRLAVAQFSDSEERAYDELFAIFEEVFGKELAWPAWEQIHSHGLFAVKDLIFMHKAAYEALVQEFGKRKVGYYDEKARYPLRDYLSKLLDDWVAGFPAEYKKMEMLFGDLEEDISPRERRMRTLRYANNRRYSMLNPLTGMWLAPEVPIIGHFWGGASLEEILAAVPRETILDYLVFQWARYSLRLDLTKPGGGSQNEEVMLPNKIFKETIKMLRAEKRVKTDFYGYLHR